MYRLELTAEEDLTAKEQDCERWYSVKQGMVGVATWQTNVNDDDEDDEDEELSVDFHQSSCLSCNVQVGKNSRVSLRLFVVKEIMLGHIDPEELRPPLPTLLDEAAWDTLEEELTSPPWSELPEGVVVRDEPLPEQLTVWEERLICAEGNLASFEAQWRKRASQVQRRLKRRFSEDSITAGTEWTAPWCTALRKPAEPVEPAEPAWVTTEEDDYYHYYYCYCYNYNYYHYYYYSCYYCYYC